MGQDRAGTKGRRLAGERLSTEREGDGQVGEQGGFTEQTPPHNGLCVLVWPLD